MPKEARKPETQINNYRSIFTMSSHERAHHDDANNVTYQRCQFAYEFAKPFITGKEVLDVGCGMAYGTALMAQSAKKITGIDYDQQTVTGNSQRYASIPNLSFRQGAVPPLPFADQSFDVVTAFQFIEHIEHRKEFIKEALRVLKPGGSLLVTTPNVKKSLARNPFHVHEYTFDEMKKEVESLTPKFQLKGLNGNDRVNTYYEENGKFVRMILKWDVLKLHRILPAAILTKPYNWVTSLMRNKLKEKVSQSMDITTKDFHLQDDNLDAMWDIYLVAGKQ
ncbi:MAG: methyltransferase domain-containing protein [Bacteroidetes bacterium]|nr:methyltransferase domain-containing protein [Bacteroidota bacterium]